MLEFAADLCLHRRHIFVVMEVSTRRIVHCNQTESPTLDWVKIQIRDIAAFDRKP